MMSDGSLDISVVSAVESARDSNRYLLLPDLAISCDGPVNSVMLFSKVAVKDLAGRKVLVSRSSMTSVALLELLFAERWKVSRDEQDAWALESQQKAARAWQENRFGDQIVPIEADRSTATGSEHVTFARDELVRGDTSAEKLAKLPPAFKVGGTVTAGNASPYSDGAAALVLMKRARAEALGITPLARFVTFAAAGVPPDVMGVGPIKAVPKALRLAGMSLSDIDLIEFNEAFASQIVASVRDLGMLPEKGNVNGGAIALGHPLGATGAKLTTQLIHELRRRGGGRGLVTMCVGGGMGAAGIFEVAA
jgi:acetyl-CoA acyltransferase